MIVANVQKTNKVIDELSFRRCDDTFKVPISVEIKTQEKTVGYEEEYVPIQ